MRTLAVLFVVLLGCLPLAGCSDDEARTAVLKRRANLSTIAMAYHSFDTKNERCPAGIDELARFMGQSAEPEGETADAMTALTERDITVIWNGTLGNASENARFVLAYEASVPARGGYVVMADGTVALMTAKDFSESALLPSE